jgi:ABC-2 type transport system permease protein
MNPFVALLTREGLEHRIFALAPLAMLALLIVATLIGLALFGSAEIHFSSEFTTQQGNERIHEEVERYGSIAQLAEFNGWTDRELANRMDLFRVGIAAPFQFVYLFIVVFVLLGGIHDERKDRSILFWKSMPVSDLDSVASKILLAVWIAPLATVAATILAQTFLLIVISGVTIAEDLGDVGRLWWQSGLLTGGTQQLIGYLIQGFWALPLYGWLLLVSATATKSPVMWASLVPFVPALLERMLFGTTMITTGIFNHLKLAALPSLGPAADGKIGALTTLGDQVGLFATTDMWLGVIVGALFLYATIYCRGRFNEI